MAKLVTNDHSYSHAQILGVSEEAITYDYALTAYGREPAMPHLIARLEKDKMFRDNWLGFQNMGSAR